MKTLLAIVLAVVVGCADVEGESPETETTEDVELGVTQQALVNGCYRHVVIKPTAPGWGILPHMNGTIWDLVTAGGTSGCIYQSPGAEFLHSASFPGGCAQYDARTWYCSGVGPLTCPATAGLSRPHQASDNFWGPYTAFGRYHISYHSEVSLPFTHSYWDSVNKTVACAYSRDYKSYRYKPGM